jgi:hypothetical protein
MTKNVPSGGYYAHAQPPAAVNSNKIVVVLSDIIENFTPTQVIRLSRSYAHAIILIRWVMPLSHGGFAETPEKMSACKIG